MGTFTLTPTFLADANAFRTRAAEFLAHAMRRKSWDDFDVRIAMEYERLARSAEDAAVLFEELEKS